MTGIHDAIRAYLLADTAIASLVGTRIGPPKRPQGGTYPLVELTWIGLRVANLRTPASLATPRLQIDVWTSERSNATAFSEAERLGRAIRRRMEALANETIVIDDTVSPAISTRVQVSGAGSSGEILEQGPTFDGDVNGGYWRHMSEYRVSYGTVGGMY